MTALPPGVSDDAISPQRQIDGSVRTGSLWRKRYFSWLELKRVPTVALLGAFVVGGVIRCLFVGEQSFWWDEIFTHNIVYQPTLAGVLAGVKATESTPPLFYVLTWIVVKAVGSQSDATIRLVSVAAGVLTVPAIALAFPRFIGRAATAAVGWLFALSPLMVWYSLEGRSYALFILAGVLTLWSVGLLYERQTKKRFALWVFTGLVCVYTHYFAIFLLVAEFTFLALFLKIRERSLVHLAVSGVGLLVLSLPLAPLLLGQDDARSLSIEDTPWGHRLRDFIFQFPLGGPLGSPFTPTLRVVAAAFGTCGFLLGLRVVWVKMRNRNPRQYVIAHIRSSRVPKLVLALLLISFITMAIPFVLDATDVDKHLSFRNLLVIWPYLAGIAALGLLWLSGLPLLGYLVILAIATNLILTNWRYEKPDWRDAARIVKPLAQNTPVITYPGNQTLVASYYLNRKIVDRPVVSKRVWLMLGPKHGNGLEQPRVGYPLHPPTGFKLVHRITTAQGFRLLEYVSAVPRLINPHRLGSDGNGGTPGVLAR